MNRYYDHHVLRYLLEKRIGYWRQRCGNASRDPAAMAQAEELRREPIALRGW